jgi:hypothetical protein
MISSDSSPVRVFRGSLIRDHEPYFPQPNLSNQAQIEQYSGLQRIKEAHPMGEK